MPGYSSGSMLNQNNNDFPNNNSGQITPAILRGFNANLINSVQFTDVATPNATSASYAATASIATSASYASNADLLDGLNSTAFVLNSQTSSMSVATASFALTASFLQGSIASASFASTASFTPNAIITASVNISTLTFTKGDGTTFDLSVAQSGSVATASLALNSERLGNLLPASYLLTSSFNTYTASQATTNGTFATTSSFNAYTGSTNTFTASSATSASNALVTASVSSNVVTFTKGNGTTFALTVGSVVDTGSLATTASLNAFTASINTFTSSVNTYITASNTLSSSYATKAEVNAYTGSTNAFSASMKTFTGSIQTQFNSYTSSINAYTGSTTSLFAGTASFATTSSFSRGLISGLNISASNVTVTNNLVVNGTASFAYTKTTTGSAVIIGDAFIILNADTPTLPFAGIKVFDTGSASTASFEWNGNGDYWIGVEESGASAGFLTGTSGSKGSEAFPTLNRLTKGSGNNEIRNSNITDNGTNVSINSNTTITGSLGVSSTITGTLSGTASFANNATSASYANNAQQATSASFATTASFALNVPVTASFAISASYAVSSSQAQNAVSANTATSASYASTAQQATSASFATTASFALNVVATNTGSLLTTASFSNPNLTFTKGDGTTFNQSLVTLVPTSASFASTASFVQNAVSASFATTASLAIISTYTSEWILGDNANTDYTFSGPGFTGSANDPTIYLVRGQQYKFTNTMGAHPFRIQTTVNGSTGPQYNNGVTNNDVSNGTLTFNVPMEVPDTLYYQCTAHASMGGPIYLLDQNAISASFATTASFASTTAGGIQGSEIYSYTFLLMGA